MLQKTLSCLGSDGIEVLQNARFLKLQKYEMAILEISKEMWKDSNEN